MNITKRENRSGDKIVFYYDFGRAEGQRHSTGIFIYKKPKDQIQKNHNKEALALLELKKSQLILTQQATGTAFIPSHNQFVLVHTSVRPNKDMPTYPRTLSVFLSFRYI